MKYKNEKVYYFEDGLPIEIKNYLNTLWINNPGIPYIFEWRVGRSGLEPDLLSEALLSAGAEFDTDVIVSI